MSGPVFLYGTLCWSPLFALVAGPGETTAIGATLSGHRVAAGPAGLPVLVGAPGQSTTGVLVVGLTDRQRARLDRYEVPFGYLPGSVLVEAPQGPVQATAYRPPPGLAAGIEDWSLAAWVTEHGEAALAAAVEIDLLDPEPDQNRLARDWGMIGGRAAARVRARANPAPTVLRHSAAPGEVAVSWDGPLRGRFFRLADLKITYGPDRRNILREVLVGTDAALVLPFDPARDRVLLVEQIRAGPAGRGDPQPFTLEPVAGMVDAGESPDQAGLRECLEEAGITPRRLIPMFNVYASPGNATDHFFCFLGLADLPDELPRTGGLVDEGEDIRLHLLPFAQALELIETGEANVAPLVAMILWLARRRDRLRAEAGVAP